MPIFDLRNCPLISAATDNADEGGSSERSTDTQVGLTDRNVPFFARLIPLAFLLTFNLHGQTHSGADGRWIDLWKRVNMTDPI